MILNVAVLGATLIVAALLLMPRVATSRRLRATVTPLASIIGSGFLILGPILDAGYGAWAPLVMALLCLAAYAFGGAVRYNIGDLDRVPEGRGALDNGVEIVASWALAFAYVISVAYYLNLFGSFGVSLTPYADPVSAKLLTSAIFGVILVIGWLWGFAALERAEQLSVGVKLAIIAGLLTGLAIYAARVLSVEGPEISAPEVTGWPAIALAFGLIVTVQGFETSRYLGRTYDAGERIRSMRLAQWVATAIYMTYILLLVYVFPAGEGPVSETAIIDLMGRVTPVLPPLLVAAALSAQFSAAVADTGGSGGLLNELTKGRLTPRISYAVLVGIGVALTWTLNVFEIVAYASRAFAAYYALQSLLAALACRRDGRATRAALFAALALLGLAIAVFGAPVEG